MRLRPIVHSATPGPVRFACRVVVGAAWLLAVGCGADDGIGSAEQHASETPLLAIVDRGMAEGILAVPNPVVFPTAATFQSLRISNQSSFGVRMSCSTTSATFVQAQGSSYDEGVFRLAVPGKLKFTASPGEVVDVDLLPGEGDFTCAVGTYVLAAQTTEYHGDTCWPEPIAPWCAAAESTRELLTVTVEGCDLPNSVTARIAGADHQLLGHGEEPFAGSRTFVADGAGFTSRLTSSYGTLTDHATLRFNADGAVAGADVHVTGGHTLDLGYLMYDAHTCVPSTCEYVEAQCGSIDDSCGGTVDCGGCAAPMTCGGAGVPNRCAVENEELVASVPYLYGAAFDGQHVYYQTDGTVVRVPPTGGSPEVIVSGLERYSRSFDVDDNYVYTAPTDGTIQRIAKVSAATPQTLADAIGFVADMKAQPEGVYVVADDAILRVPHVPTQAPIVLASGQTVGRTLAFDDTHVYWIHRGDWGGSYKTGAIRRAGRTGGQVEELVSGVAWASRDLAVHDDRVLWLDWEFLAAPIDGSTDRVTLLHPSADLAVRWDYLNHLTIDGALAYVAHRQTLKGQDSGKMVITSVPLDGGVPTTVSRLSRSANGEPVLGVFRVPEALIVALGSNGSNGGTIVRVALP